MGIFSFFSKDKKETLDKGLSKTKESVFSKITKAIAGKSKVDDDVRARSSLCFLLFVSILALSVIFDDTSPKGRGF